MTHEKQQHIVDIVKIGLLAFMSISGAMTLRWMNSIDERLEFTNTKLDLIKNEFIEVRGDVKRNTRDIEKLDDWKQKQN